MFPLAVWNFAMSVSTKTWTNQPADKLKGLWTSVYWLKEELHVYCTIHLLSIQVFFMSRSCRAKIKSQSVICGILIHIISALMCQGQNMVWYRMVHTNWGIVINALKGIYVYKDVHCGIDDHTTYTRCWPWHIQVLQSHICTPLKSTIRSIIDHGTRKDFQNGLEYISKGQG